MAGIPSHPLRDCVGIAKINFFFYFMPDMIRHPGAYIVNPLDYVRDRLSQARNDK